MREAPGGRGEGTENNHCGGRSEINKYGANSSFHVEGAMREGGYRNDESRS